MLTDSQRLMTHWLDSHPNEHCLPVAPVTSSETRPLWSVLIPTHNCAAYLEQTLTSVLAQDPGPEQMEILVVDDHSTKDDPVTVVDRLASGRVNFIRQAENVGKSRNYQTGLNASRGQLIHQLHGDDKVGPDFYQSMASCFERFPQAGAFFCESQYIDEHNEITGRTGSEREQSGVLEGWLEKIYIRQRIQTPSVVLRRDVYEQLGGFDQRLSAFEDWEMWVRTAVCCPVGFNANCTAQYRVYHDNTSHQSIVSGQRPRIQKRALRIIDSYVPEKVKQTCGALRAREVADYLTRCLPIAVQHRRPLAWFRLCGHIATYSWHPRVWYYVFRSLLQPSKS